MDEAIFKKIRDGLASLLSAAGFLAAGTLVSGFDLREARAHEMIGLVAKEVSTANERTEEVIDAMTTKMSLVYPAGGSGPVYDNEMAQLLGATERRDECTRILAVLAHVRSLTAAFHQMLSPTAGPELLTAAKQVEEHTQALLRLLEIDPV